METGSTDSDRQGYGEWAWCHYRPFASRDDRKVGATRGLGILMKHLKVNPKQRHRAKPLIDFDVPMRRKFPISQPYTSRRLRHYNKALSFDFRVKPFGFVQTVSPVVTVGDEDVLPIAPFERDLAKSRRLPWVDFNTGKPIALDWNGTHLAGTVEVMRLSDYIDEYARHAEAKAADRNGNPAGPDTIGMLGRLSLRSICLARIGKEVDRLDEDEGASLERDQPVEYARDDLTEDIQYLAGFPQEATARDLGLTERGWRNLINAQSKPRQ